MRISATAFLTVAALFVGACGGSDDEVDPTTPPISDEAAPTRAAAAGTVPVFAEECETEPNPDDYPDGQIPPIIRPCDTPTELVVHTIRPGTGPEAESGDTLIADYSGIRVEDGRLFDTSFTGALPLSFPLGTGGVIPGWDEGLIGTQAGGLYKLDIPTDLAYADSPPDGSGIEPGDALTFIVEVRAVVPAVAPDDAPLDVDIQPSDGAVELTITDLVEGDGAVVEAGDTAVVHMLLVRGDNEIVLLNTWERGDPLQIPLAEGGSLPGIVEGLEGATVGTRRVITMPPDLAFGEEGNASLGLPAGRDLIVVADVVGVF